MRNIFYNFETHLFNFCYFVVCCCTLFEPECTLKNASEGTFTPSSCISFFLNPKVSFDFFSFYCSPSCLFVSSRCFIFCLFICLRLCFFSVRRSRFKFLRLCFFSVCRSRFICLCISSPFVVHDSAIVPHSSHVHQLLPTANDTKHFKHNNTYSI